MSKAELVLKLIALLKRWDDWESNHLDGLEADKVKRCRLMLEGIVKEVQNPIDEFRQDKADEIAHKILRLCESRWQRRESEPILPAEIAGMLDGLDFSEMHSVRNKPASESV